MKRSIIFILLFSTVSVIGNGVGVVDAGNGTFLELVSSDIVVEAESQIAIVTSTQVFKNTLGAEKTFTYSFPLPDGASAIDLLWEIDNQWYRAIIDETPQDSTLPGGSGGVVPNLTTYLGQTPLNFEIPDTLAKDSTITVKIVYVQLMPYEYGNVDFIYPNDYQLIQNSEIENQNFRFELNSPRTITSIQLLSDQIITLLQNDGNAATLVCSMSNTLANEDYIVRFSLDLNQLGLFSYSTKLDSAIMPDSAGNGYFTFIAEPDPTNTDVIDKVFTLIIDRSGSMNGDKIIQARDAAKFVVENLNEGDKFNIVDFASNITSFRTYHTEFTSQTRDSALTYINNINASGGTNISGAFGVAIPQFSVASDSTANIIIFFTDGRPNGGITDPQQLVNYINNLINQTETDILLFSFGIGSNVNKQVLTLLSNENNGLVVFLEDDDLYETISNFYLQIRNPVLLNTQISFEPASNITEVYPDLLPSLYIGQQMIVSGRYESAVPVNVTLSGTVFGQLVSYQYPLTLADTAVTSYQFLTKLWAKSKIEDLLIFYNTLDPSSQEAEAVKAQIISISLAYNVISPFTSFTGGDPVGIDEAEDELANNKNLLTDFELHGNYPNPFNPSTTIKIKVNKQYVGILKINIYNSLGQVIRTLELVVNGVGIYEVFWDGRMNNGLIAASGQYFYIVRLGDTIFSRKMLLLK